MGRQAVDVRTTTSASPDAVYALLRDNRGWPAWTPLDSCEIERQGDDGEPEGVGTVRVVRNGRHTMREEIVELAPSRRFSYTVLSGLAVRGYRADVDLEPTADGTAIRWRSSFTAKVPGTGRLYRRALTTATRQFAEGLAEHARERSAV